MTLLQNLICIMLLLSIVALVSGSNIVFPPADEYSGDYVYITEPGRYTLEHDIMHSYPVGVIIAAPSVILDGQGFQISPSTNKKEGQQVGVFITACDKAGNVVTGVTLKNISVTDEVYGIYVEGKESDFAFGMSCPVSEDRTITLLSIDTNDNLNGIVARDVSSITIDRLNAEKNDLIGVKISNSAGEIKDSIITGNTGGGISLSNISSLSIKDSHILNNENYGILVNGARHLLISNNLFDNPINFVVSSVSGNDEIKLNTEPVSGNSITGGTIIGGNFWATNGEQLYGTDGIDVNHDGICDNSYSPSGGFIDYYPLIPQNQVVERVTIVPTALPVKEVTTIKAEPIEIFSTIVPEITQESVEINVTPVITKAPVISPEITPKAIISGMHAAIISDTFPSEMTTGETKDVTLTICNDGTAEWMPGQEIGIAALDKTVSWGQSELIVPISGKLVSKGTHAFSFKIRAPSSPGVYELKYQAVKGFESGLVQITFGRPYRINITVR